MSNTSISYLWREPKAAEGFKTGVSLHSHTNQSKETLDFIADMSQDWPWLMPIMRWAEDRSAEKTGIRPQYTKSYWTPPLTPKLAYDLEEKQIENLLQLPALVSLSDHDDIKAPMLLRSLPSIRHIPVSLEWTVPFGPTAFHLGVHNLPSATGAAWQERLAEFTVLPIDGRDPKLLTQILAELDEIPGVLTIFNHPLWDLYRVGADKHGVSVNEFLAVNGQYIHALELNGLRTWKENTEVTVLAGKWNQIVISGGDRHGIEPNANLNLTNATSFNEFVHEVRRERISHMVFMPQYREPWKHRILQGTLDAIRNYPHFPEGMRNWDERVFHPDSNGEIRPLSTLWKDDKIPRVVAVAMNLVRKMESRPFSRGLKMAWSDAGEMRAALAELDA
jgi:hypothetical protein